MIQGGWEYIRAAYAAPWIVFGLYGLTLWLRWRKANRRNAS